MDADSPNPDAAAIGAHRVPAGLHCPRCEYDLSGLPSTFCPECGLRLSGHTLFNFNRKQLQREWMVGGVVNLLVFGAILYFTSIVYGMASNNEVKRILAIVAAILLLPLLIGFIPSVEELRAQRRIRRVIWIRSYPRLSLSWLIFVIFFMAGDRPGANYVLAAFAIVLPILSIVAWHEGWRQHSRRCVSGSDIRPGSNHWVGVTAYTLLMLMPLCVLGLFLISRDW